MIRLTPKPSQNFFVYSILLKKKIFLQKKSF